MAVTGVLLAAGAGRRAGGPKALQRDPDGRWWLRRSLSVLRSGGCGRLIVVVGAAADQAREVLSSHCDDNDPLPAEVSVVEALDWQSGMAASLRAGLQAAAELDEGVCLHLVDLPDVGAEVIARVIGQGTAHCTKPSNGPGGVLARASYFGKPGHPVLIGTAHLAPIIAELEGDVGAKAYLLRAGTYLVECGDLASGQDHDLDGEEPR